VIDASRVPGGRFDLRPISRALIGADGTFTARVAPTVDLRESATHGVVNLQAWAVTGSRLAHWGFSRNLTNSGALAPASTVPDFVAAVPSTSPSMSTTSRGYESVERRFSGVDGRTTFEQCSRRTGRTRRGSLRL